MNLLRRYRSWASSAPFGEDLDLDVYDFIEELHVDGEVTFRTAEDVRKVLRGIALARPMRDAAIEEVVERAAEAGLFPS